MSLLTNVMDHSLDEGYAEAAARKEAEGAGGLPKTARAKLALAAGLVLAALVVTVGAANARLAAPSSPRSARNSSTASSARRRPRTSWRAASTPCAPM